jgi:NADH-quinone oxidoreductase subunit E
VLDKLERSLGIRSGETTGDLRFTLETVNCMGCCALGPVVKVDDEYFGQMKSDKVDSMLNNYQ